MGKQILVISSSPRKEGNSDLLCDQFVLGSNMAGNTAEKIFLRDKTINYCTGCGLCFTKGKGCSQKDDMAAILDKMVNAEVIVMATPVYFYTMCAQMKTLIDRTCARYTEIINKDFYFIMTSADSSKKAMDRTIAEFRGFISCLDGANEREIIFGTGAWEKGDIKHSKALSQAYEIGMKV